MATATVARVVAGASARGVWGDGIPTATLQSAPTHRSGIAAPARSYLECDEAAGRRARRTTAARQVSAATRPEGGWTRAARERWRPATRGTRTASRDRACTQRGEPAAADQPSAIPSGPDAFRRHVNQCLLLRCLGTRWSIIV